MYIDINVQNVMNESDARNEFDHLVINNNDF